jgi:hypothetical protein
MGISAQEILKTDPEFVQRQLQAQEMQRLNPSGSAAGAIGAVLGRGLGNVTQGRGFFEPSNTGLKRVTDVQNIMKSVQFDPNNPASYYQQIGNALLESGYGDLAPMAFDEARKFSVKTGKDTITVPAGSTVIDRQGNVLFQAPKDVKADNKVLPPGSVMVNSTGEVIARGEPTKTADEKVSSEWKRYQELLKLGTPEPEARSIAYKTANLDFRKDLEESKKQEAAKRKQDQFSNTAGIIDNVMTTLDTAVKQTGTFTAGTFGTPLSFLPGTAAKDLAANLETIKANLGFDRLQQMRDASPTGGALGQVAIQELVALQSTVASLDNQQSPSQLKKNLNKVKGHYEKWRATVKKAMEQNAETIGETQAPSSTGGWSIVR